MADLSKRSIYVPGIFGVIGTSAIEYWLTGGLTGLTPLWAGIVGIGCSGFAYAFWGQPTPNTAPPTNLCPHSALEIIKEFKGVARFESDQISKKYKGQFLTAVGEVAFVGSRSYLVGQLFSLRLLNSHARVESWIRGNSMTNWASSLRPGDIVEISGKIADCSSSKITLAKCHRYPFKRKQKNF